MSVPWSDTVSSLFSVVHVSDISYLKSVLPQDIEPDFYTYLKNLNTDNVVMYAMDEGTVVFPKVPLLVVQGPLPVVQLMETALLNLVNYARYT